MGFNKRQINFDGSAYHLKNNSLKEYYGSSDALDFQDEDSFIIYKSFVNGETKEKIFEIINLKNGGQKL
jgi:hypothetical protein